jgi:small subunit ribosomal protein S3
LGRKVHPIGFRLGVIKDWDSQWYAEGEQYAQQVVEDNRIRELVRKELGRAGVSRIVIERYPSRLGITLHTAKPGVVIGRRGATVNALKDKIVELTGIASNRLRLDVMEIGNPDLSARVVAESVAEQLERRVSHRRAMRTTMRRSMRAGAGGIKIACKGRLSGSEMARRDWAREGRVPLHTLRADIDFAVVEALTTFGRIGVQVWIYRGEIFPEDGAEAELARAEA